MSQGSIQMPVPLVIMIFLSSIRIWIRLMSTKQSIQKVISLRKNKFIKKIFLDPWNQFSKRIFLILQMLNRVKARFIKKILTMITFKSIYLRKSKTKEVINYQIFPKMLMSIFKPTKKSSILNKMTSSTIPTSKKQ